LDLPHVLFNESLYSEITRLHYFSSGFPYYFLSILLK
jgi:hypothetical protein